ncbi:uncharacterized protein B0H18DRAFT_25190 [Fomitopsis serialis]|uniref:uncharacterized protein n=1 Tax=Fomitopsis serialis TaxID=139415 RepID=UPI002007C80E|nr:uncharacterized protein B0H18DRAFT_25190 [Neoantrodia serialis]KAH9932445.1 hypothetical protein B0H18DRAFT_25190 [Neoantrodia serialis]
MPPFQATICPWSAIALGGCLVFRSASPSMPSMIDHSNGDIVGPVNVQRGISLGAAKTNGPTAVLLELHDSSIISRGAISVVHFMAVRHA